jgi:hypothetical protein
MIPSGHPVDRDVTDAAAARTMPGMSELATLHPYDPAFVARYLRAVRGELAGAELVPAAPAWAERELARARDGFGRALSGDEAGANRVSYGLARLLAATEPVFLLPGAGLTQIEARYERGIGMLLRPPSRLFADAGLETAAARAMPIRLDAAGGSMGGAFIPPSLTEQFDETLERRLERLARHMAEAELDAPALLGVLLEAAGYAAQRGLGLYEALDVVVPGVPESEPPGLRAVLPDRKRLDRDLRKRLEAAARPPKEPGFLARLLGRGGEKDRNPHPDAGRRWRGMNDVTPPPEPTVPEEGSR